MISTSSLRAAPSPHSFSKASQLPLGLENGHLTRLDAQKFLVPSLPVSVRSLGDNDLARKSQDCATSGVVQYPGGYFPSGIRDPFPRTHPQRLTPPQHDSTQSHLTEANGFPGLPSKVINFPLRSAVPIPCSSPSPASSASPHKPQSPSSPAHLSGSYVPPVESTGLVDLTAAAAVARMYTGMHASTPQLSPYYSPVAPHMMPFSPFSAHPYGRHPASPYLEGFRPHSTLQVPPIQQSPAAVSPSRPPTAFPLSQSLRHLSPLLPPEHNTFAANPQHKNVETPGRYYDLGNHCLSQRQHSEFQDNKIPSSRTNPETPSEPINSHAHSFQRPTPAASFCEVRHPPKEDISIEKSRCRKGYSPPPLQSPIWSPHCTKDSVFFTNSDDGKVSFGRQDPLKLQVASFQTVEVRSSPLSQEPTTGAARERFYHPGVTESSPQNIKGQPPCSSLKRPLPWNSEATKSDILHSPQAHGNGDHVKYLRNQAKPSSVHKCSSGTKNASSSSSSSTPESPYFPRPSSLTAQAYYFQFPSPKKTENVSPDVDIGVASAPPGSFSTKPLTTRAISNPKPLATMQRLPPLEAFSRGSLTQLPGGGIKRVEELKTEDFLAAAASVSDSVTIVTCTVTSIHLDSLNSLCKLMLTFGSPNQQVILEASDEQPFFVIGRGWSSSSPVKTERRLSLPCKPLSIGDVCITLRKNPNRILKGDNQSLGQNAVNPNAALLPHISSDPGRFALKSPSHSRNAGASSPCTRTVNQSKYQRHTHTVTTTTKRPPAVPISDSDPESIAKKRRWSAPEAVTDEPKPRATFANHNGPI